MSDERSIVIKLQAGSHFAFNLIYSKYHKPLYSFASGYIKDKPQIEDAIQNLFVKLWEERKTINENLNLKSFLFTSLKNYLLNEIRNAELKQSKLNTLNQPVECDEQVTARIDYEFSMKTLNHGICNLPRQKRKICELKVHSDLSNQEIAEKMNISIHTVKVLYNQSIKKLRGFLENNNISLENFS